MIIEMDGFETGATLAPNIAFVSGTAVGALTGRDGVGIAIRGGTGSQGFTKQFTSSTDTIYWHQGWRFDQGRIGDTTNSYVTFSLLDTAGTAHLTLNTDSTGHLTLRRGSSAGGIIATSTLQIPTSVSTWYSIEVKATIHDTAGECVIKMNGEEWINFTGDTRNGGVTRPGFLQFGVGNNANTLDDLLVVDTSGMTSNTWTGEISIVGVRPAGNGAFSDLLGSDGNSVNNYQQVDESPLNTTDYNASSVNGAKDTYDMSAVGKIGTVLAVQSWAYVTKSDTGAKSFKHVMRSSGGTLVRSSAVSLGSTTYVLSVGPLWATDGDGLGWTVSRVDNHEFGIEVQ